MNKSLAVQPCRIPGEIPHFKNEMGNNWSPQRQESVVFPLNNWTISTATRTTSQKHTNIYRSNFKSVKSMDKNGKEKVSSWWSKQAMQRSKQKNRPTNKSSRDQQPRILAQRKLLVEKGSQCSKDGKYMSQQDDNRPDVTRLLPARQTFIKPREQEKRRRYAHQWTKEKNWEECRKHEN